MPDGETTIGRKKIKAQGLVTSQAGKKAVGEMLNGYIANLAKDPKDAKEPKKGAIKDKGQGSSKKSPADLAVKNLQKDIKAFLGIMRLF